MKHHLLVLLALCLLAACASPQHSAASRQNSAIPFTGKDVADPASGLIVIADQPRERILVANHFGEFRLELPYATDWVFQPVRSREQFVNANSQSQNLIVTVQSYQPGNRVDPANYLQNEILANVTDGLQRRFGVEPENVELSNRGGRPVLEYDLTVSDSTAGGAALEVSQHNLWAMLQRHSDGVVLDLHVSTTVPASQAGDAGLARFHDRLAEMMGADFAAQPL